MRLIYTAAVVFILCVILTMCGCTLPWKGEKQDAPKAAVKADQTVQEAPATGVFAKTSSTVSEKDNSLTVGFSGGTANGCSGTACPIPGTDQITQGMILSDIIKAKSAANVKEIAEENRWKTIAVYLAAAIIVMLFLIALFVKSPLEWFKKKEE